MKTFQYGAWLLLGAVSWTLLSSCSGEPSAKLNQASLNTTSKAIDTQQRQHDALLGKWNCRYEQQLPNGLRLSAQTVDDYLANGQILSEGLISLQSDKTTVDYKLSLQGQWQFRQNQLQMTQLQLTAFEVSDPAFENNLQFKQQLLQTSRSNAQIVQLDATELQLKSLDAGNENMQTVRCRRA